MFSWRLLIFTVCLLTAGAHGLKVANEEAAGQFRTVEKSDWAAANVWIKSAECTRTTGAWLAICEGNKLFPIARFALADDPGQALFLGLLARIQDRAVSVLDVARMNIVSNLVGMVAIAALLFAARLEVASLTVLMLGAATYFSWVGTSPHPGLIGAASMAAIFPLTVLLGEQGFLSRPAHVFFLVVGAVLLAWATMFREPIGFMGFFITVGALVYLALKISGFSYKLRFLLLLGFVFCSWQTPRWVLMARDTLYPIEPVTLTQTHGVSHNLYIGLGAGGINKFGIRWDDSVGDAAVKSIDPSVQYVSPQYFRILWGLYLDRVAQDPLEVVRIYSVKLRKVLQHRLPSWAPPLWLFLPGAVGLLIFCRRQTTFSEVTNDRAACIVVVTALAFIGMFFAQGVLGHPSLQYAHPIGAFVLLILAIGFELFTEARAREAKKVSVAGD